MKKTIFKVLLFIIVNIIGFSTIPVITVFLLSSQIIDVTASGFNQAVFEYDVFFTHSVTWMICAIFSITHFFLKGMWRQILLFSPIVIPFVYTMMNMVKYF